MPDSPVNQAPQVNPAPPYAPQLVGAPPPKSGPSVLKVVLIVVAVFVGLGLIGAGVVGYGIYRVAQSVHMVDSSSPLTESDLGVAIYPGAVQNNKGSMRMSLAGKSIVTGVFSTPDAKDQVIAFYQGKLGSDAQSRVISDGETFFVNMDTVDTLTVTIEQKLGMAEGRTLIVIVHTSKVASN